MENKTAKTTDETPPRSPPSGGSETAKQALAMFAEAHLNVACALGEMTVAKFAHAALLCEVAASKLRHLQRIYDEPPNNGGEQRGPRP